MSTEIRHYVRFLYPGVLFPEETRTQRIDEPTVEAILAVAPTETEGTYFVKDGWYCAELTTREERKYTADEVGADEIWSVITGTSHTTRYLVGEAFDVDAFPDDDAHRVLKSNMRGNWPGRPVIKTRAGNHQPLQVGDVLLHPESLHPVEVSA